MYRPGIIASLAEKVAAKNISIENIDTTLRTRKTTIAGEVQKSREFVVNAYCSSKDHGQDDAHAIVNDLGSLKDDLGLDVLDIRVQTDKSD